MRRGFAAILILGLIASAAIFLMVYSKQNLFKHQNESIYQSPPASTTATEASESPITDKQINKCTENKIGDVSFKSPNGWLRQLTKTCDEATFWSPEIKEPFFGFPPEGAELIISYSSDDYYYKDCKGIQDYTKDIKCTEFKGNKLVFYRWFWEEYSLNYILYYKEKRYKFSLVVKPDNEAKHRSYLESTLNSIVLN